MFTGRTDAEVEVVILWPPDVKSWLTEEGPDAGENWRQKKCWQQRMRWLDSIPNSVDMHLSELLGSKAMTNGDSILKSWNITLPTKVCLVKAVVFPVVMCGCERWDCEESWAPKDWCFWTVVLEKTLKSPLDCKEVKPVNPKRNQSWIFIQGLMMLKLKLQYFGHLMQTTDSLEKNLDAGQDWRREEKGMTEDKIVGWHHRLNEHEF